MSRKIFIAVGLALLLGGCQRPPTLEQTSPGENDHPPIIVDYYAAKSVHPGETWKVYLRGKDVDGDMKYIVAVLNRKGSGLYPTSEIWLHGEERSEFEGYIFMNTPANTDLIGRVYELKLRLFIRDWAGNKRNTVELPMTFAVSATPDKVPAQWQEAAGHELGYINNSILNIEEYRRLQ